MYSTDPHQNEYLAAAAGMAEAYGVTHAKGDRIAFRLKAWGDRGWDAGNIIDIHDGKLLVETDDDVIEVDPRPWPQGNVLPF